MEFAAASLAMVPHERASEVVTHTLRTRPMLGVWLSCDGRAFCRDVSVPQIQASDPWIELCFLLVVVCLLVLNLLTSQG